MLRYFFTYEEKLPDNVPGFSMYGPFHIGWLLVIAAMTVLFCLHFRRLSAEKQDRFALRMALVIVAMDLYHFAVLILIGEMQVQYLPFHLCGMAVYLTLLQAIFRRDWLNELLYFLCLPGALSALLFPDWTRCPPLQFECVHGFLVHGLLVAYSIMLLAGGRLHPRFCCFWKVIVFLAVVVPPIYVFNKRFGTNFMFVNWPSPGSPLVPIAERMGNPGYLIGYTALALGVMTVWYLPLALFRWLRKHRRVTAPAESG